MFEKIVVRRSAQNTVVTLGEIAEAMLFYKRVHLVLDYGALVGLITSMGASKLLDFLSRDDVTAVYCDGSVGVYTDNGVFNRHAFTSMRPAGNQETGPLKKKKEIIQFIFQVQGKLEKKAARKAAEKFEKLVPIKSFESNYFIEGGLIKAAETDLQQANFVNEVIRYGILNKLGVKVFPQNILFDDSSFFFQIQKQESGFGVLTSIDFTRLNNEAQRVGCKETITEASLLVNILDAKVDEILSQYYGGEFYTSDIISEIIRLKYERAFYADKKSNQEKEQLFDIINLEGRALREAINSGAKSFDDFLKLIDKSSGQKFKSWLNTVNPDKNLVSEYIAEKNSQEWLGKLPGKSLRYAMTTIAGLQPALGIAASAADTFLVDKISLGWRPNHFIDKKLLPFLEQ